MNKNLTLAITSALIIFSCGGTETVFTQMSEEESQRINSSSTVIGNTLMYAYCVSKKYAQSVPPAITNATVAGDYGTVTFTGTSSEANNRIMLILSSKFDNFGNMLGKITEFQGSDTIFMDKNSGQLLEYRTQLRSCIVNYISGTGSFTGTIRFNPTTISKQTDTNTTFTSPYQITGLLQSSNYQWNLDERKTFMTTFRK